MSKTLSTFIALFTTALGATAEQNLLVNGGFEDGLDGWSTGHSWYEAKVNGKGTGISAWEVDEHVAHAGSRSAKVVGKGNRGIIMQLLHLPPAFYRVSGCLKCENLGDANASILVEFLDKDHKWFQGITAGSVSGTTDWTRVEKEIPFPTNAVWIHFDLLTSAPNSGLAWFDEIELSPVATEAPLPTVSVTQQPSNAGEVALAWAVTEAVGIEKYEVYVEPRPFKSLKALRPQAVVDWTAREATMRTAGRDARGYAAVIPVMVDGRRQTEVRPVEVALRDTKPPRPVELWVRNSAAWPDSLLVEWQPCPLDEDLGSFRLYAAAGPTKEASQSKPLGKPRPLRERMTWLPRATLPVGTEQIGITAVDTAGNESSLTWQLIPPPLGTNPQFDLWVASPLLNVFRDTPKPANASNSVDLLSARNETEVAQIVLTPRAALEGVYVEAEPLLHENGKARIGAEKITWNFVGYVHVEKNSTATPPEELLRKAPADFPDPLMEQRALDLKPDENQPVFLRVSVPKKAPPGRYRGNLHVVTSQGSVRMLLRLEVLPFTLPDQLPIHVTNWFSPGNFATYHRLTEWSEDYWRTLRLYAREMHRAHQNVVFTSLDLVKVWREEDGKLTFDYTDFDRWVRLFEQEGVAERIELTHLGGRTTGDWMCPTFGISSRPSTDRKTGRATSIEIEQFLPDLQRHLEAKGWLQKTLLHIGDEPIPVNVKSWREQSARAHRAAPKLKRIDAIHVPAKEVEGHLEVLVPQLNYFDQWLQGYREAQAKGSELWFYIAWVPQGKYTNRLIDLACIKTRLIHWINFLEGATGYLHWGLNFWTDPADPNGAGQNMGFAPGDNWIIYPGKWGPRSSLRWEAMREGLEDFAYFTALAKQSPERARELARQVMRSITDYDKDPEKLEQTRRQVAREVAAGTGQ